MNIDTILIDTFKAVGILLFSGVVVIASIAVGACIYERLMKMKPVRNFVEKITSWRC